MKRSEAAALIEGLRELLALDRAGLNSCDSNTVGDLLKQHGVPEQKVEPGSTLLKGRFTEPQVKVR